ncbi:MAG: hypothetical protein HOV81_32105 [Kofleriaceae bacterium]|nr:hypothetical protein [Kofleriaceae bacterium]
MRLLALLLVVTACTDEANQADTIAFDLDATITADTFWDLPFPSDLRLTADGRPDLDAFPNTRNIPVVNDLLSVAKERHGWPVMPIAYFHFTGAVPQHALADLAADALIVDIDEASPEHGKTFPVVAQTLADDSYGKSLVAVAPRPGIVLRGTTRYAVVLRRGFAPGVEVPRGFADLAAGKTPAGSRGAAAATLYAPLWATLDELDIDDALVATVFTTGDEVAVLRARSEALRTSQHATIANLQRVQTTYDGFCSFTADVTFPQFQKGTAPFDSEGRFALDENGTPIVQSMLTVPLRITLPLGAMPAGGWPLWQYFHGSGGASFDLVDEGPSETAEGPPLAGEGPGAIVARRGIAAAASSLPVDNERLPGAGSYDYLNLNNLAAFPYTFQQGVFEQRMLLDALLELEIPSCDGTPGGHFDPGKLVAGGHSMGGMYTNMVAAVEPRYGALTPFGAGGFWNYMILDTAIVPGAKNLLGGVLGVDSEQLTFVHPALGLIELGWEIADPINAMARLSRRPLPGIPARHVYQPIGLDDKYFPNQIFDAAALAYGNREAGEVVWPGTQDALRLDGMDGLLPYPVKANNGGLTSVVVQYRDGGIVDAHQIYRQLDEVKYQYGCFLASYLRDGVPTVPAPAALSSACP